MRHDCNGKCTVNELRVRGRSIIYVQDFNVKAFAKPHIHIHHIKKQFEESLVDLGTSASLSF